MRQTIVTEFITLDGIMENPAFWQNGQDCDQVGPYEYEELFGSGALLLGRVTYDELVGY